MQQQLNVSEGGRGHRNVANGELTADGEIRTRIFKVHSPVSVRPLLVKDKH